jgi:16S rRNA (cytidine1402-2'-O)-methyltransferase
MVKPVKSAPQSGLVFAATPMGNAGDASVRLIEAISGADLIAAEDTRKFRQLASRLGADINGKVISYFEANEASRVDYILDAARNGQYVLVVTDAGMPNISDPGYRLVVGAIEAEMTLTVLPGPSAVLTALVLSGLPSDRFCFEGFLPRKAGERLSSLRALAAETRTMVFFEAPHRINKSVLDMVTVFGADRLAAICREMTKTYEEVVRAPLGELAIWAQGEVRGEITVVVAGISPEQLRTNAGLSDMPAILDRVQTLVSEGTSLKDASAQVAQSAGISKRDVYQAAIAAKADQGK